MTTFLSDPARILEELRKPFPEDELEWRINQAGRSANGKIWCQCLCYVTARAIQERLDKVCGPFWQVHHRFETIQAKNEDGNPQTMAACMTRLGIKLGNEWVWREDGSDPSDIEAVKGAISGGMKRAGVLWGMGRDLYALDNIWADVEDQDPRNKQYFKAVNVRLKGKDKDHATFWWRPPMMPDWYLRISSREPLRTLEQLATPPAAAPAPAPQPEQPKPSADPLPVAVIGKILDAFMPLGLIREQLEAHLGGVPCEKWTQFHRNLLVQHLKDLQVKAKTK